MAKITIPAGFDLPIAWEAAELVTRAYTQINAGASWSLQGDYTPPGSFSAQAGGRKGSPAFAERFHQPVPVAWRTVITEDLVTAVPVSTPGLEPGKSAHGLLGSFIGIAPKLDFEHVGTPVSFTSFRGSMPANHQMPTDLTALNAAKAVGA